MVDLRVAGAAVVAMIAASVALGCGHELVAYHWSQGAKLPWLGVTVVPPSWMGGARDRDHYEVLGVERDATTAQIKAAYRALALQHHPDKVDGGSGDAGDDSEEFRRLSTAHEVLANAQSRKRYDGERVHREAQRGAKVDGLYQQGVQRCHDVFVTRHWLHGVIAYVSGVISHALSGRSVVTALFVLAVGTTLVTWLFPTFFNALWTVYAAVMYYLTCKPCRRGTGSAADASAWASVGRRVLTPEEREDLRQVHLRRLQKEAVGGGGGAAASASGSGGGTEVAAPVPPPGSQWAKEEAAQRRLKKKLLAEKHAKELKAKQADARAKQQEKQAASAAAARGKARAAAVRRRTAGASAAAGSGGATS